MTLGALAIWWIAILVIVLDRGWQAPFGIPTAMSEQNTAVVVDDAGHRLDLDPTTAADVDSFLAEASAACWSRGTPVLSASWQWGTTVPWLLGAAVPPTLMLTTVYPNEAAQEVLRFNLDKVPPSQWDESWLLTSDPSLLAPGDAAYAEAARQILTQHLGRAFPDDYRLAARLGVQQLWRPVDSERPAGCVPADPPLPISPADLNERALNFG